MIEVDCSDFMFSAEEIKIPYTISLRGKYLQINAQRLNGRQIGAFVKGEILVGRLDPDKINPVSFSIIKNNGEEERILHSDLRALYIEHS